jgi:hypothetical protein
MSLAPADYLVHASNVLLLAAYSVRNMLWLRCFAVAAALINIPYFLLQTHVLWPPIGWAVVFMAINVYQIGVILRERRPVVFSEDEQKLYAALFQEVSPRDFVALVMLGEWRDAAVGDAVLDAGKPANSISVAISGTIRVSREGRILGDVGPGHLVGTTFALLDEPSPVDAAFADPGRYISWQWSDLRAFLDKKPELRAKLVRLAGNELARKLQHLGHSVEGFARF